MQRVRRDLEPLPARGGLCSGGATNENPKAASDYGCTLLVHLGLKSLSVKQNILFAVALGPRLRREGQRIDPPLELV